MDRITIKSYAKVNLYLDITGIRSDGYHLIESIMQSVSLCDLVTVEKTDRVGISIECNHPKVPCDERNIAYKTVKAFLNATNLDGNFHIIIDKKIPVQAGMGGGSADCSAVLKGLNIMNGEPLNADELMKIGTSLGADVPFCLVGGTKLCTGIGEIIQDISPIQKCYFVIVQPNFYCSTSNAYKSYDNNPIPVFGKIDKMKSLLNKISDKNSEIIKNSMYNVFEDLYKDERIDFIKADLIDNGAICAMMTGSGSAVFGIFDSYQKADEYVLKCIKNSTYPFVQIAESQGKSMDILTKYKK